MSPLPEQDEISLIDFVATRDLPCPRCDYNLRGISQPQCPECGEKLELGVYFDEPYNPAWVRLVAMVCMGAGAGSILLLGVSVTQSIHFPIPTILFGMQIPMLMCLYCVRRRMARLSRSRLNQLTLADVFILVVGSVILFSYF